MLDISVIGKATSQEKAVRSEVFRESKLLTAMWVGTSSPTLFKG